MPLYVPFSGVTESPPISQLLGCSRGSGTQQLLFLLLALPTALYNTASVPWSELAWQRDTRAQLARLTGAPCVFTATAFLQHLRPCFVHVSVHPRLGRYALSDTVYNVFSLFLALLFSTTPGIGVVMVCLTLSQNLMSCVTAGFFFLSYSGAKVEQYFSTQKCIKVNDIRGKNEIH